MKTILSCFAAATLFAQPPSAPAGPSAGRIEFEVASIKPANPALSQGGVAHAARQLPGGFEARNLYLKNLIMSAYRLNEDQLIGGPGWMNSAGWDIDAKFPVGAGRAQIPEMMQALLAERFHLVCHRETRILPVYNLVVARGGSKLKESAEPYGSMSAGPRMIKYTAGTMDDLVRQLSSYMERQVLDHTGLQGRYDIQLSFAPVDPEPSVDAAAQETGASIFTAIQEQLGLRLEEAKGPVEVLVIDSVEKPSEN